jgi:hypothetical protein
MILKIETSRNGYVRCPFCNDEVRYWIEGEMDFITDEITWLVCVDRETACGHVWAKKWCSKDGEEVRAVFVKR